MTRIIELLAIFILMGLALITPQVIFTRGPFLQKLDTDSVTIVCKTATTQTVTLQPWGFTSTGTTHVFDVTGLQPGTPYQYSVGSISSTFKTAPLDSRPFRFVAFGDSGTGSTAQLDVRNRIDNLRAVKYVDFVLGLGDLVYERGEAADFNPKLFTPYSTFMDEIPFWPTLGNHDVATSNGQPYLDAFYLPTNNPAGTERYYSFNYGNAHFVCLDSETSSTSAGSPMMTWLAADLTADDHPWTFAFLHRPPYSRGTHNDDSEVRDAIVPTLEAHGVDMLLAGHSHVYERSYLVQGGLVIQNDPSNYTKPPGTMYLVSGCGGKSGSGSLDHRLMSVGLGNLTGFSYIEVDGLNCRGFFVDRNGVERDAFTLSKGPVTPVPPVAAFVTAPNDLSVQFTDASTGTVDSWAWTFGDGQGSAQENPTHTYPSYGDYLVTLDVSGPAGADHTEQTISVAPPPPSGSMWISSSQLASLPISGPEWDHLFEYQLGNLLGCNLANQNDELDSKIFAAALVSARLGTGRDRVVAALDDAMGSDLDAPDSLGPSRGVSAIVLAADLVGHRTPQFRAWVNTVRTRVYNDGRSITSTHEDRPNNWGTWAGASRLACSIYLQDGRDMQECAFILAGWLGYRVVYDGFQYGDTSWQFNELRPVGINGVGASKDGHLVDGVLPDDQRRSGEISGQPYRPFPSAWGLKTNYSYEALQGVVIQAVLWDRAGFPVFWRVKTSAIKRAFVWLRDVNHQPLTDTVNGDNDWWMAHILNQDHIYQQLDLVVPQLTKPGRSVGWAEWTALAPSWP